MEAGARTLKEAASAAIRDWVGNVETTHYVIGSAVGPAPYPGARARPAAPHRRRGARAAARGGRPAARPGDRLRGRRLERDRDLRRASSTTPASQLIGVEAAGEGLETRRHSAPLTTGARGVLHGALSAVLQDEEGQILEAHSVSAGLDYPGVGPRARLPARQRAGHATWPSRTPTRWPPSGAWPSSRGSCRRWSRRTRWRGCWPTPARRAPRPDDALGTRRQGPRRGARARLMSFGDDGRRPDRGRVRLARQACCADAVPDGRLPVARMRPPRRGWRPRRRART